MTEENKELLKIILIVLGIIGVAILLTILINNSLFSHTEGLVYRTETGSKYHSPGCGYLWNSAIAMGYEQAKKSSLGACSRCGGIPKGTIIVNNYFAAFLIALTIMIVLFVLYAWAKSRQINNQQEHTDNTTTIKSYSQQLELKQNEEKIEIDKFRNLYNKNKLVNAEVAHCKFGKGKIMLANDKYIWILFESIKDAKQFQFPQAFIDGFLKFTNDETKIN